MLRCYQYNVVLWWLDSFVVDCTVKSFCFLLDNVGIFSHFNWSTIRESTHKIYIFFSV